MMAIAILFGLRCSISSVYGAFGTNAIIVTPHPPLREPAASHRPPVVRAVACSAPGFD